MSMSESDWTSVRTTPLLEPFPDDTVRHLLSDRSPRSCEAGRVLFLQGDPAETFFLVLDGCVKSFRVNAGGEEVVLGVYRSGEWLGDEAILMDELYFTSADVVASARLLAIPRAILWERMRQDPNLAVSVLQATSTRLDSLCRQIAELKLLSASQRVGRFLLDIAPALESPMVLGLPYGKGLIARHLGMKPESFSRALAKLRTAGVVVEDRHVVISDVELLSCYVRNGRLRAKRRQVH